MTPVALLTDAFERIRDTTTAAVDGLDDDQLAHRPTPDANPIAWLVWHLARVQDDHVADVAGLEQVWTAQGFDERFGLDVGDSIGYGMSSDEVGRVRAPAALLASYVEAVHAQTTSWLAGVTEADLDRVVDEHWDPPVTLATRLVSVIGDDLQHAGQAAYLRGMLGR